MRRSVLTTQGRRWRNTLLPQGTTRTNDAEAVDAHEFVLRWLRGGVPVLAVTNATDTLPVSGTCRLTDAFHAAKAEAMAQSQEKREWKRRYDDKFSTQVAVWPNALATYMLCAAVLLIMCLPPSATPA